ncbi:competence protein transcription factor [Liquorilactobacillus aquaticus DSM 21051]|uniref:Competence protein transcription factor n=2 Tax=Liquorilactobacillus aquaticus TaxID=392566 RepID=A0A0R2CVF5_9LACO|nr:competence protein transcription factor [Liquorilactobacillus aquaticus DSM 21051]
MGVGLMLVAESKNGSILAGHAKQGEYYWCPGCKAELILKKGNFKISHFAHKKKTCQIFSEGETSEHLAGKKEIFAAYKNAGYTGALEQHIKVLNQRPDILIRFRDEKTIAIEFQCAPLNLKKLYSRSEGYRNSGLKFCWILGQRYKVGRRLTQQIGQFMQWTKKLGFYLLYFDTLSSRFELIYGIQQIDFLPVRYYRFCTGNVDKLKEFMSKNHKITYHTLTREECFRQKNNFFKSCSRSLGNFRRLQEYVYQKGFRLQELEPLILKKKYGIPLFYEKELYWRTETLLQQGEIPMGNKKRLDYLQKIDKYLFKVPFIDRKRFEEQLIIELQGKTSQQLS